MTTDPNSPYIIVSADSHAGLPTEDYRAYLSSKVHPQFDEFLSERAAVLEASTRLGVRNEDYAKKWFEEHEEALEHGVQKVLVQLAESVLLATQDYVRSLAVARSLGHTPDLEDSNSFLDATWRVVLAEKRCDEQLRSARRLILKTLAKKPAELMLANDLAASLEQASDCLLVASYALRDIVLSKAGAIA